VSFNPILRFSISKELLHSREAVVLVEVECVWRPTAVGPEINLFYMGLMEAGYIGSTVSSLDVLSPELPRTFTFWRSTAWQMSC